MIGHFKDFFGIFSIKGREQCSESFVKGGEQRLAHRHTTIHCDHNRQDFCILADRFEDLFPHHLIDELIAPSMSWIESPDIVEFLKRIAMTFLNSVEVAIEIEVHGCHIELERGSWNFQGFQNIAGHCISFDYDSAQK